jgi:hypothetical protein
MRVESGRCEGHDMPITRTLITTLAIIAVAVPGAQAQDLRSPHARHVAERPSWTMLAPPVAPWPAAPGDDSSIPVNEDGADIDWAAIFIGGVAAVLVATGIAGLAVGTRHQVRVRRARAL